jgi:hypothetical protein
MIRIVKKITPAPIVSEKMDEYTDAAKTNSPVNVEAEPKEEDAGGLSLLGIGGKQLQSGP